MKLTSPSSLIYRVQRFLLDPINKADTYEWIGRAMSLIGGEMEQELKTVSLEIKNNIVELPCDYVQFIRFIELVTDEVIHTPVIKPNEAPWITTQKLYSNQRLRINDPSYINSYNAPNHSYNRLLDVNNVGTQFSDLDYSFGNNTIKFNIKTGTITMQYWGLPTDNEGLPLIPDEEEYLEAIQWYCLLQMSYQGFIFRDKNLTSESLEAKWDMKKLNARAWGRMPDREMMERLKNESTRMMPIINHYENAFKYLGTKEILNRHGKYK